MQFLFGPVSGKTYRMPMVAGQFLLVSLFVMALDYVVMAIAGSIWLLLAGRIVGGITAATHATAAAFMADVSKPHEKAANFGLLGAAFGLGFVLGPLMGGMLSEFGTRAPFWAAACLSAFGFVAGLMVMPETVTDENRRPFRWRRANPAGALQAIAALPGIRPLLWVYFLYSVSIYVYPAIWSYFTLERFRLVPPNDRPVAGCLRAGDGCGSGRADPTRNPISGRASDGDLGHGLRDRQLCPTGFSDQWVYCPDADPRYCAWGRGHPCPSGDDVQGDTGTRNRVNCRAFWQPCTLRR